jgi:hypothetical protein
MARYSNVINVAVSVVKNLDVQINYSMDQNA